MADTPWTAPGLTAEALERLPIEAPGFTAQEFADLVRAIEDAAALDPVAAQLAFALTIAATALLARARALEEAEAGALASVRFARSFYDEAIFLPTSESVDARSARLARGLLDGVRKEIVERFADLRTLAQRTETKP